jgi:hypothetical protein
MEVRDERDSIKAIRISENGFGEVLNTTFIGHDSERNLDFFQVDSPYGFSTFGIASLSSPGNFFQILYLSISSAVSGGGGGGGGGDNGVASSASPKTSIATVSPTQVITAIPTVTQIQEGSETGSFASPLATKIPGSETAGGPEQTVTPPATGEQAGTSTAIFTEGTTAMVLLKNLSVVGVVVIVTVVFYFRWKREEE